MVHLRPHPVPVRRLLRHVPLPSVHPAVAPLHHALVRAGQGEGEDRVLARADLEREGPLADRGAGLVGKEEGATAGGKERAGLPQQIRGEKQRETFCGFCLKKKQFYNMLKGTALFTQA